MRFPTLTPTEKIKELYHLIVHRFHNHQVKYIIAGRFATNFHGYKRATGDLGLSPREVSTFESLDGYSRLLCGFLIFPDFIFRKRKSEYFKSD